MDQQDQELPLTDAFWDWPAGRSHTRDLSSSAELSWTALVVLTHIFRWWWFASAGGTSVLVLHIPVFTEDGADWRARWKERRRQRQPQRQCSDGVL